MINFFPQNLRRHHMHMLIVFASSVDSCQHLPIPSFAPAYRCSECVMNTPSRPPSLSPSLSLLFFSLHFCLIRFLSFNPSFLFRVLSNSKNAFDLFVFSLSYSTRFMPFYGSFVNSWIRPCANWYSARQVRKLEHKPKESKGVMSVMWM